MSRFRHLLIIAVTAGLLGACGGAPMTSDERELPDLADQMFSAVWHAEFGASPLTPQSATGLTAEDGNRYLNALLVLPPTDASTYVHGVFALDIPDREEVVLSARVGFLDGVKGDAIFRIYIQDGAHFPILSEVQAVADGRLDTIQADLAPYRGENRLVIFAVSLGESPLAPVLWAEPSLHIP